MQNPEPLGYSPNSYINIYERIYNLSEKDDTWSFYFAQKDYPDSKSTFDQEVTTENPYFFSEPKWKEMNAS